MKKELCAYNMCYLVSFVLLNIVLLMTGCAAFEKSATPISTGEGDFIQMTPEIVIKTSDTPNPIQGVAVSSPFPATITPNTLVMTSTLHATSMVTSSPTAVAPDTAISLCGNGLQSVPASDPSWSAIIERVDELRGFYSLALSPNGQYLAAVEREPDLPAGSRIYLWEVSTGEIQWRVKSEEAVSAAGIFFSPDGSKLATGASDTDPNVFVWEAATGNLLHKFPYPGRTTSMSFSSDNKYLTAGGLYPTTAVVWNLEEGSAIELSNGNGASFVPNSEEPVLIVYKAWRRQDEPSPIYELNLLNGQQEYLFPGANSVDGVALSSDGQLLSTVSFEDEKGTLKIFNLQEDVELQVENSDLNFVQVRQLSFSSADYIAVLQGDLSIWNADGRFLACLDEDNINGFIFTPNGSHVLTYGLIREPLKVWELSPP